MNEPMDQSNERKRTVETSSGFGFKSLMPLIIISVGLAVFLYMKNNQPEAVKSEVASTPSASDDNKDDSPSDEESKSDKETKIDEKDTIDVADEADTQGKTNTDSPQNKPENQLIVEVIYPEKINYQPTIYAFGQVEAVTQGQLVSQVAGEIIRVNEVSAEGALFNKGDELIAIDDRDFNIALTSAMANLASAESNLLQEKARSVQAETDWRRLGNKEEANDLVLRKPQLLSAKSAMDSASAGVEQAKLDIERTKIKAPYKGQVIERMVSLGQFVNRGEPLLEIYATDKAQVKLPLNSQQLSLIDIDEPSQHALTVSVEYGKKRYQWPATIVRSGAVFDESSRQLTMIAEVENPFSVIDAAAQSNNANKITENRPSLKLGQFVQAEIKGRTFEDVYLLPQTSVYQNRYIYTLEDNVLTQQAVDIIYNENNSVIVTSASEISSVVITPLSRSQLGKSVLIKDENDSADNIEGTNPVNVL